MKTPLNMGSSTEDNMNKQELTQYLIDNKLTIKEIDNLPEGWTKVINYFNQQPDSYELIHENGDKIGYASTLLYLVNIPSPLPDNYMSPMPDYMRNEVQIKYIEPLRLDGKLAANKVYFSNLDAFEFNAPCIVRSGYKYQFRFLLKEDADKFIEIFKGEYVTE